MIGRRAAGRAALLLAAVFAATASCARGGDEVVFWQFFPAEVVTPILERFGREHPGTNVRMEQLTWQSGREKITAAIASGNVPDLCELGSTWMPSMLESGQLADWSAGVVDLRPQLRGWELCSIGDAVYGIPWMMGTRALFYNKSLFARAGLDSTRPPETWEELQAAAAAIHRLGGGVSGYGVQAGEAQVLFKKFMPFAWGNGGRILSDDLRVAVFDSPENRAALEFYLGLRAVGRMEQQDVLDRAFKEGRIGLLISGAWLFRSIPRDAPDLRYGVALVPRPERERGTHASFAGGEVLVSFAKAKHRQAALELARFLVRPENALALATATRSVQPAVVGIDTAAYYRSQPGEALMIRQFETAVFTPNHPQWDLMEKAIEEEIEEAMFNRKTAAEAVAAAQQRVAELVGEALTLRHRDPPPPGTTNATSWLFLSPWIATFALFGLYPFAFSLIASFTDYSPIRAGASRIVGFENYARALADPAFWTALRNTAVFVVGTIPFTTALALALAVAVQPAFRGRTLFRVGFFMPTVVSVVVLSLVFKGLYATDGAINGLLATLGLPQPAWLNDPRTALPAIMAMDVWAASGYYMVILLAGLETIPRELYDAARLEGASAWTCFVRITLPLLRPTLLFVLVVNTVRSLQIFAEVFVMTRGGPLKSTTTVVYYLYEQAFHRFDLGYASAVAYLLFVVTLGLAFVQMRALRGAPEGAR